MTITFEIMKRHIPTITGVHCDRYDAAIASAEAWFVSEILNASLLLTIATDPAHEHLLKIVERLLSCKAYGIAIPTLDLVETARGFGVVQDDNLVPASPARVQALRASMDANLASAIDLLLEMLEQTSALHAEWRKTPSYSLIPNFYIDSLRQMRDYGAFKGTRLEFIKAVPVLKGIALRTIEPWISRPYSAVLLAGGSLSGADKTILENMRFALVSIHNGDTTTANAYLTAARQYMMAAPDDYPAFKGSDVYRRLTSTPERDPSIGVFV